MSKIYNGSNGLYYVSGLHDGRLSDNLRVKKPKKLVEYELGSRKLGNNKSVFSIYNNKPLDLNFSPSTTFKYDTYLYKKPQVDLTKPRNTRTFEDLIIANDKINSHTERMNKNKELLEKKYAGLVDPLNDKLNKVYSQLKKLNGPEPELEIPEPPEIPEELLIPPLILRIPRPPEQEIPEFLTNPLGNNITNFDISEIGPENYRRLIPEDNYGLNALFGDNNSNSIVANEIRNRRNNAVPTNTEIGTNPIINGTHIVEGSSTSKTNTGNTPSTDQFLAIKENMEQAQKLEDDYKEREDENTNELIRKIESEQIAHSIVNDIISKVKTPKRSPKVERKETPKESEQIAHSIVNDIISKVKTPKGSPKVERKEIPKPPVVRKVERRQSINLGIPSPKDSAVSTRHATPQAKRKEFKLDFKFKPMTEQEKNIIASEIAGHDKPRLDIYRGDPNDMKILQAVFGKSESNGGLNIDKFRSEAKRIDKLHSDKYDKLPKKGIQELFKKNVVIIRDNDIIDYKNKK